MNNFDKVYNSILGEGKASRRRGKREIVEEMLPALAPIAGALARGAVTGLASGAVSNMMSGDEDAENVADYRERFADLHSGIQEFMAELDDELRDHYDSETIDMVLEKLEVLAGDY